MQTAKCPNCGRYSESMTFHQCPYCGFSDIDNAPSWTVLAFVGLVLVATAFMGWKFLA